MENLNDNEFLKVRCINPHKTVLKLGKCYNATKSENHSGYYVIDVGWNLVVDSDTVEVVDDTISINNLLDHYEENTMTNILLPFLKWCEIKKRTYSSDEYLIKDFYSFLKSVGKK